MSNWYRRIKDIKNSYNFYAIKCNYGRSFTAKMVDSIFLFTIVSLSIFFISLILIENIILSSLACVALLTCIAIVLYMRFKKEYRKLRTLTYDKIRSEEAAKKLENISRDDFRSLLTDLLSASKMFSDIVVGKDMIECLRYNAKCAIGYDVNEPQNPTQWETVEEFIHSIQYKRYEYIIFFTNTEFEGGCHALKRTFKSPTVFLIEKDYIVKILINSGLYHRNIDLEEKVKKEYNSIRRMSRAERYNVTRANGPKSLLIYSLIFGCLAFLSERYFIYYMTVSVTFIILALLLFILRKRKVDREEDLLDSDKEVEL